MGPFCVCHRVARRALWTSALLVSFCLCCFPPCQPITCASSAIPEHPFFEPGMKREEGFLDGTLIQQLVLEPFSRLADTLTTQQSRIQFDQRYISPLEEDVSNLLQAVELFHRSVASPVGHVVHRPYEVLRRGTTEVDNFLRTLLGVTSLDEERDAGRFGTVQGTCERDKTYTIQSIEDLQNNRSELECIFARGEAPIRPPLGVLAGRVLEAGSTDLYNYLLRMWWAGKLSFMTRCGNQRDVYMLQNIIHSSLDIPAYTYIGTFTDPVAPGEYVDSKPSLIYDYTVDFGLMCPEAEEAAYKTHLGVINNQHPFRNIVDVIRKVGETADGGHILLGKAYLRDPLYFPDRGDILASFWAVVAYDKDAFGPTTEDVFALSTTEESFTYRHQSIIEVLRRFLPVLELFSDPTGVGPALFDSAVRWRLGRQLVTPSQAAAAEKKMGAEPVDSQYLLGNYAAGTPPFSYLSGTLPPRPDVVQVMKRGRSRREGAAAAATTEQAQQQPQQQAQQQPQQQAQQ